jgi:hypothetical protein
MATWKKIITTADDANYKNSNHSIADATSTATGLATSTQIAKLDGIEGSANNYSLPTASSTVLGGVKIGDNLNVSTAGALTSSVPTMSASTKGGAKLGLGMSVSANGALTPDAFVITLSGDATGTATITSLADATLSVTVVDDSHSHFTDHASLAGSSAQNFDTNDLTVTGNLTVSGTTTTVNSTTVELGDNIITLNVGEAGTPSVNAGIEIERGTSPNKKLIWDETEDRWGVVGSGAMALTRPLVTNFVTTTTTAPTGDEYGIGSMHMAGGVPYIRTA